MTRRFFAPFVALFALAAAVVFSPPAVSAQQPPAPQITLIGNGQTIANGDSTPQTLDGTDFGSTPQGSAVQHIFIVRNTGNADLSVTDVSPPAGFTASTPGGLPVTLGPNRLMLLFVTCTADASGTYSGSLSVDSTDPDEDRAGFEIACEVEGAPDIDVSGNTNPITNGDTTPSPADGTEFGTTAVGTPVIHTFRVSNRGKADLTIDAVTLPPGFTAVNTLPSIVPSGGQADVQVRCNAATDNAFTGNLSIANNDPDESPFSFRIHCTTGDNAPDFNPGPDDLPPSTATAVPPINVPTPPQSGGGINNPSTGGDTSSAGNQGGNVPIASLIDTATVVPQPRPTSTPTLLATVRSPVQGIFQPPSTGDAGLETDQGGPVNYEWLGAVAALLAAAGLVGLKRVRP